MSFPCKKCSYRESLSELELHLAARLIEYRLCQKCFQWKSLIDIRKNSYYQIAIIKDICYWVGNNKSNNKFTIRFRDGKQITTYNLISFGKVPKRWHKILCNNARFIYRG
jgi:hypothetical protein